MLAMMFRPWRRVTCASLDGDLGPTAGMDVIHSLIKQGRASRSGSRAAQDGVKLVTWSVHGIQKSWSDTLVAAERSPL